MSFGAPISPPSQGIDQSEVLSFISSLQEDSTARRRTLTKSASRMSNATLPIMPENEALLQSLKDYEDIIYGTWDSIQQELHYINRIEPAPSVGLGCQRGFITISKAGAMTLAVSLAGALCLVVLLFWQVQSKARAGPLYSGP